MLTDTRRLADSFAPIDFFEDRGLPYVVGLNCFDGKQTHGVDEVRDALADPRRRSRSSAATPATATR